jgi:hypothetical protein
MSALTDALADLRVRVLTQLADRKGFGADEGTVRNLAKLMTDAQVLAELDRRQQPFGWLRGWWVGVRRW